LPLNEVETRICARRGTVQHQTKVFYFVALKFAGLPQRRAEVKSLIMACKVEAKYAEVQK
jgi:hypothetical protein